MPYKNPPNIREISGILRRIRNWLLSHDDLIIAHRYEGYQAKRTQPPPNLPPGVSAHIKDNYYYTRDGRRESRPPTKVFDGAQTLLEAGSKPAIAAKSSVRPGFPYNWETGRLELPKE